MNNQDKMLQLVLSDEKLSSFYEFNANDFSTIEAALNSGNPIVAAVVMIIQGVAGSSDKGIYKEIYNEVVNYLNQNML
jgi:precorrin isomerase